MDAWQQRPDWSGRSPCTDHDCEAVLTASAQSVTRHLDTAPERTSCSASAVMRPVLTQRVWRTPTHAVIASPANDNGPYGDLTPPPPTPLHPQASGPEYRWIAAHVEWKRSDSG